MDTITIISLYCTVDKTTVSNMTIFCQTLLEIFSSIHTFSAPNHVLSLASWSLLPSLVQQLLSLHMSSLLLVEASMLVALILTAASATGDFDAVFQFSRLLTIETHAIFCFIDRKQCFLILSTTLWSSLLFSFPNSLYSIPSCFPLFSIFFYLRLFIHSFLLSFFCLSHVLL